MSPLKSNIYFIEFEIEFSISNKFTRIFSVFSLDKIIRFFMMMDHWWCFCYATTILLFKEFFFVMIVFVVIIEMHSIHFKWNVFFLLFFLFFLLILSICTHFLHNILPSRNIYDDEADHYLIFISIIHIEWKRRRLSPLTDLNRLESMRECKFVCMFCCVAVVFFFHKFFFLSSKRKIRFVHLIK